MGHLEKPSTGDTRLVFSEMALKKITSLRIYMGMGQNPIPLVNIKIAGKWMFIPLKMVCIGIDP
jgi:hypothetical protein